MSVGNSGVVVPQETIEDSNSKKKAKRTLRQLPIYRDTSNLKYMIVSLYKIVPVKLTKYIDSMVVTISEAKKCVGLAESSSGAERAEYLKVARVFIEDIQDDATILTKLNVISKEKDKQMKVQARSIIAQCVAWRDYTNGQGAATKDE